MSNPKHTPEPWFERGGTIWNEDMTIAIAVINTFNRSDDENKASAARIVACVNAMQGIEDPQKFIEKLKGSDLAFFEATELEKQRDELLDALKLCKSVIESGGLFGLSGRVAMDKADAAIAKAEGRAS